MSSAVVISPNATPESWHELVVANGGCFFHRHEWLTTMADALGMDFHALTVEADGKPVGVAPMLVRHVGPVRTVNWLPFPYVGPLVPAELLPDVLPLLAAWERRRRTVRSQHVLMSTVDSTANYVGTPDRTFVVELAGQDEELLLRNVTAKRRAKLRRAITGGVQVRPATEVEVCELLPAWTATTFAAQGLPEPYPAAAYATVWAAFGDSPDVRFSTAVVDGAPVCVQGSFAGAPVGVAWVMANAGTKAASFAQPLLYWDTIMWAHQRRCVAFDLVGAPTEGVAAYKRDWGAREKHYTVLRRQVAAHRIAMRLRAAVRSGAR